MFNVLLDFNRTAVNICKPLLVATIVECRIYLFVCADVSNKLNFAV